jgi:hypothetical protein
VSHYCDFCQMEHSAASCYHPGRSALSTLRRVVLEEAERVDGACPCRAASGTNLDQCPDVEGDCCACCGANERHSYRKDAACLWPGHAIAARLREAAGGKP